MRGGRGMGTFDLAMSLGPTCRTKLQLRRVLGSNNCVYGIFDAQITPYNALCQYFLNGFRGHFEPGDVETVEGRWRVRNQRYGTFHPHLTPHGVPVDLNKARERHEWLCSNVRRALSANGRLLFVREHSEDSLELSDLKVLIAKLHPKLRFEIATVKDGSEYASGWQGSNLAWDEGLSDYKISKLASLINAASRVSRHLTRFGF